jgi:hypothetical protein
VDECAIIGNVVVIGLDNGVLFWDLISNDYWVLPTMLDGERVDLDDLRSLGDSVLFLPVERVLTELQRKFIEA